MIKGTFLLVVFLLFVLPRKTETELGNIVEEALILLLLVLEVETDICECQL